jgi:hypothetical protein
MIPLDTTTRKLQAFLSGAAATTNPTVTVSFYDVPNQTKAGNEDYRRAPQFTVLAGTAETDICAAPSVQGTVRNIEYINFYNADTAPVTITLVVDDAGTNQIQAKIVLLSGQAAQWTAKSSWNLVS